MNLFTEEEMNYWSTQQHGWVSKGLCWVKDAKQKGVCTIWFYLFKTQRVLPCICHFSNSSRLKIQYAQMPYFGRSVSWTLSKEGPRITLASRMSNWEKNSVSKQNRKYKRQVSLGGKYEFSLGHNKIEMPENIKISSMLLIIWIWCYRSISLIYRM